MPWSTEQCDTLNTFDQYTMLVCVWLAQVWLKQTTVPAVAIYLLVNVTAISRQAAYNFMYNCVLPSSPQYNYSLSVDNRAHSVINPHYLEALYIPLSKSHAIKVKHKGLTKR